MCVLAAMLMAGLLAPALFAAAAGAAGAQEAEYPPRLPDGAPVGSATGPELLRGPAAAEGVTVAAAPPAVDFLYYPCQTYKAKTWSCWGDGSVSGGVYYSAVGDHNAPAGNAFVYAYDPAAKSLRLLTDVAKVLALPAGHYVPGKVHSRIDVGDDGCVYFATHRGSTRVTTDEYHYEGDWIMRHDPRTGKTDVLARGPAGKHCIPCSVLDPRRLIFYGGTAAGDPQDKSIRFFAYDVRAGRVLYQGEGGPGRYMMLAPSTGRVYFTPGAKGPLHRFDPAATPPAPVRLDAEIGLRAATRETPDGFIYAVGDKDDPTLYRFSTAAEKVEALGPAPVGGQAYITSIDADPSGRYLYYVPGAHGGSDKDGAPVVQYDVRTRTRKIIAYLHPFLKERFGFTPIGTFSTAVDEGGGRLFMTWNGCTRRDPGERPSWDAAALVVLTIPESERKP
jgi:hypothetical protein